MNVKQCSMTMRAMLRQVITFAKEAEKLLTENGEEDSAFYFGQLKDWLVENPSKVSLFQLIKFLKL